LKDVEEIQVVKVKWRGVGVVEDGEDALEGSVWEAMGERACALNE